MTSVYEHLSLLGVIKKPKEKRTLKTKSTKVQMDQTSKIIKFLVLNFFYRTNKVSPFTVENVY